MVESTSQASTSISVNFEVRAMIEHVWKYHPTASTVMVLIFVPDLLQTPPKFFTSLVDNDDLIARIEFEEACIIPISKFRSIFKLRNEIYSNRSVKFY